MANPAPQIAADTKAAIEKLESLKPALLEAAADYDQPVANHINAAFKLIGQAHARLEMAAKAAGITDSGGQEFGSK